MLLKELSLMLAWVKEDSVLMVTHHQQSTNGIVVILTASLILRPQDLEDLHTHVSLPLGSA